MIEIVDLIAGILTTALGGLKNKVPVEVTQAVQAAIDALNAHKDDLITKANLEAQRG